MTMLGIEKKILSHFLYFSLFIKNVCLYCKHGFITILEMFEQSLRYLKKMMNMEAKSYAGTFCGWKYLMSKHMSWKINDFGSYAASNTIFLTFLQTKEGEDVIYSKNYFQRTAKQEGASLSLLLGNSKSPRLSTYQVKLINLCGSKLNLIAS